MKPKLHLARVLTSALLIAIALPGKLFAQSPIIYNNNATHTAGTAVTSLRVVAWGAGGGGGDQGNGGGGGACATAVLSVTPGQQFTVTIGNGGTSGVQMDGGDGGSSSFGISVIAAGGKGGSALPSSGAGGAAADCTPSVGAFSGGSGAAISFPSGNEFHGGGGGGSASPTANGGNANGRAGGTGAAVGGAGSLVIISSTAQNASVGATPGGGGGSSNSFVSPANGGKGRIIVFECRTPAFSSQPQDKMICEGNTQGLTPFSASATNTFSFQWFSNATNANSGGTAIAGATTSSYLPPSNFTGTQYFYVVATNFCGETVASNAAAFTINPLPAAPLAPSPQPFVSGATLADLQLFDAQNNSIPNGQRRWYATNNSTTLLAVSTPLQNGVTYYASRIVNNCESSSRVAVTAAVCDAPPAPTAIHISGTNAIEVSFVEDGSTQYFVQYGASGFTPAAASSSGSGVLGSETVTASPVTFAGLPCSGSFDVYVYKQCSATNTPSANSPAGSVTLTDPGLPSLPWTEDFDNLGAVAGLKPAGILPQCWKGDDYIEVANNAVVPIVMPRSDPNFLGLLQVPGPRNFWTNGFQLQAGIPYTFSFWWKGTGGNDWTGNVFVNTSQSASGATQLGGEYIAPGTTVPSSYEQVARTFTPPVNGIYYFGVNGMRPTGSSTDGLAFDDFSLGLCTSTPTISISLSSGNVCLGETLTFASSTTFAGNAPLIKWYKNGAFAATGSTFSSSAFGPGDAVFAELQSNDPSACVTTVYSSLLTVSGTSSVPPSLTLTHTPICPRTPITLTLSGFTSGADLSFVWYKNGAVLPGVTTSVLVLDSLPSGAIDNYFAQALPANGLCAPASPVYSNGVLFKSLPLPATALKSNSVTAICSGSFITIRLQTPDTINNTFQWYMDGIPIPGATNSWYDATAAGGYYVVVANANGCTKTSRTRNLTLTPSPDVTIAADGPTEFCAGNSVTLYATSFSSGASLKWFVNGSGTMNVSTSYVASTTGSYALQAKLNGCSTMSSPIAVNVIPAPSAAVSLSGPASFCANTPTTLSATANPAFTYQWQRSGMNISGATNSSFTPTMSGNYRVKIQSPGCGNVMGAYVAITVLATSGAAIQVTAQTATSATLRATVAPSGHSYRWFRDGNLISGATSRNLTVAQDGAYTLELTTASSGCTDLSDPVNILLDNPATRGIAAALTNEEAKIMVYPNPSSGIFNIAADEPVNALVKDVQGRIVLDVRNAAQIDLNGYAPGLYMLQVMNLDGKLLQVQRLIKK